MKRALISFFVLLGFFFYSSAQTTMHDSIITKNVFGGYKFYQNGERLKMGQMVSMMETNQEAYQHIKAARKNNIWSSVIGGIGGFMAGWSLGTALAGGDPNWTVAGVGAGLIVVSIPIASKANKEARQAVSIYNRTFRSNTFILRPEIQFTVRNNRIGLVANF